LSDFIAIRIVVQGLETHSRTSAYKVFCYLREVGRARFSEIARTIGSGPKRTYSALKHS